VAELVDALRSGRSGGSPVGVRVPPSAPRLAVGCRGPRRGVKHTLEVERLVRCRREPGRPVGFASYPRVRLVGLRPAHGRPPPPQVPGRPHAAAKKHTTPSQKNSLAPAWSGRLGSQGGTPSPATPKATTARMSALIRHRPTLMSSPQLVLEDLRLGTFLQLRHEGREGLLLLLLQE
jgi:hypothetical protein